MSILRRQRFLIPLALLWSLSASAEDGEALERQLAEVRRAIAEVTAELHANQAERDEELARLRALETELGRLGSEISATDQRIRSLEADLRSLDAERERERAALAVQQQALSRQLRSAYRLGGQPHLKLILDLDEPARIDRVLQYHTRFSGTRLALMAAIDERMARIAAMVADQQALRSRLEGDRDVLIERQSRQRSARDARRQLLSKIQQAIQRRERDLSSLDQDQERLSGLLAQLETLLSAVPAGLADAPFASLKGRLAWPVRGEILLAPGQPKPGGMRPEAVVIGADLGTPVLAVAHGRVAYADWLRGFGLLAIIDHGDGFMSLYGFNQALVVDVGDWVSPGQVIAEVGRSGGQEGDALYFELRQDGRPIDLAEWVAR